MRRKLLRTTGGLLTALCTFGIGLATVAVFSWLSPLQIESSIGPVDLDSGCQSAEYSQALYLSKQPQILEYCEVASRPQCYSGKSLLMKARLTGDDHGFYFFGRGCELKRTAGTLTGMSSDEYAEVWRDACRRGCPESLEVVVFGKFELVSPTRATNLNWDNMPMHFELLRVGKATATR